MNLPGHYARGVRIRLISVAIVAGLMLTGAAPAMAADRATADFVVVGVDEVVEEDLYAVGNTVDVRGTIDGDLIAFSGSEVRIGGLVTGDVIAFSGAVVVEGTVEGSVRATSGSVSIKGSVERDLVVVAGETEITGRVGRDVLVWGWALNIAGTIDGFVGGQTVGTTRISGDIGRDFEMTVGDLEVLDGTAVGGDLGYKAPQPATVESGAEIQGQLVQRAPTRQNIRVRAVALVGAILGVLFFIVGGLALFWLAPRSLERAAAAVRSPAAAVTGFLLLPLPAVVPAVIVAIATTADPDVGLPLALALVPIAIGIAGVFALAVLIAPVPVLVAVGSRVVPRRSPYLAFLVGATLFLALLVLPVVRWIVLGVVVVLGLGSWTTAVMRSRSRSQSEDQPVAIDV